MAESKMSDECNSQFELAQESEHKNYFGFKTKSCFSDMTLKVGGVALYVNKVVLEMASPVLKRMFDEKLQDGNKNEVILDDEDVEGFIEFLACIYPGCLHEVGMSNVFHILPLACKYNVELLMKKSVALLIKSLTETWTEELIFECLSVARQYSISPVLQRCTKLLVDIYKTDIHRADEIINLKVDMQLAVVPAMIPFLRSEASKYRFLSAGPKEPDGYINLEDFQDAKYSTVQFKTSHAVLVDENSPKLSTLTLWDVNLDVKPLYGISLAISGTCNTNSRYLVAAKMIFEDNIPGANGKICLQSSGQTPLYFNFGQLLSRKLPSPQFGGFDDDFPSFNQEIPPHHMHTIVVHVLMNRPTQVPEA